MLTLDVAPRPAVDPIFDSITRREFVLGTAAFALVTAACGDDDSTPSGDGASDGGSRTVAHRFGTSEVPASPTRIVTVGLVDHDAVLALGFTPIAITADDYSSDQPFGVWPWATEHLGDAEPEVLPFELNFERIAALRPDLILAIYAGLTESDFELLSEIAPTVAQSADHDDYQTPWEVMTRSIGEALGVPERADARIGEIEAEFAAARAEHPEFAGKVAVYAGSTGDAYYAETEGSSRVGILTSLGFSIPAEIKGESFYAEVGLEEVALFDRDVLVWEIGDRETRAVIEADPVYATLAVHREGRDVFVTDATLAGSLALVSVLSLRHAIRTLVPMLAAAVDGDPSTPVPDA